jgi:tol-pal system protein YbgF
MKSAIALLILLSCFSPSILAQNLTPVVDLGSPASSANAEPSEIVTSTATVSASSDRYYQMQILQEEVQMLRGMIEELNYELQQIKQRQMDDYLDIDRRLSAIAAGSASSSTAQSQQAPYNAAGAAQANSAGGANNSQVTNDAVDIAVMKASYDNASNLLLKQRDMDSAVLAFKQHIEDYPSSPYAANAYYWLGEIYLLQGQDELSRQAFTSVVEQHPNHGKAMDSRFKLGKIYHQLGEMDRARELLEVAAQSSGNVASKARDYLNNKFD